MDRIKVLRIITRLNIGGPAIHSIILTKELNDAEFESALLCGVVSKGEREMLYMARRWSVKPVLVSSLKREINPFFDMQALFQIIKFISDFKPHIVHTHTSKAGALGRIASILAGVPIRVHTFHGNIFTGYFGRVATKVFMFVERILSRFTDVVIVISSQQKSELIEKYRVIPSDRCRLVRLGFELDTFLNTQKRGFLRKRYGFNNDDILVGIIGRLVPIKNHKMFIDAVYYIKCHKDTEGLKFLLIGEGELKKKLLLYAKDKGVEEDIIFTGWFEEMEKVYPDLDIVVLTSRNEGTPVCLIEAMACARAVISTDVGGVREVIGEDARRGILIRDNDSWQLGEEILKLASSQDRRTQLGIRAREYVSSIYSKDRLVRELKSLYKKLVEEKVKI